MRAWPLRLVFLAALQFGGSSLHAQLSLTEKSLPSHQQLARHGLELAWWGQGVMNPTRDKVQHLSSDEDCVYVQSTSGIITAFDSQTGQRRWAIQLGKFDHPSFKVVSNEDVAMVVVGTAMYGINKISGKTLWEIRIPGQPSTSPAADEKHVYVGMLDGSVWAFDLPEIRALYLKGQLPEWSYRMIDWKFQASREITSPPVIFGSRVCLASRDGNVYCVTAEARHMIFQFETGSPILAPITRVDDLLYLTSEDFNFYALRVKPYVEESTDKKKAGEGAFVENGPKRDKESGKIIWEFTSGLPIRKAPHPINNHIFLLPERGGIYCLASHDGAQKWWQQQGTDFVAATSKHIYVSDQDDSLLVLSRENGNVLGSLPLRRFPVRFANDRTDRIVAASESGMVMMLREKGRIIPTFHMFPDRLPILPEFESEDGDKPAEEMPEKSETPTESDEKTEN